MSYCYNVVKAKRILVWENGDYYSNGHCISINPNCYRTWNGILTHITDTLKPSFGAVRNLIHLETKEPVQNFSSLESDEKYIALGVEKLKTIVSGYLTQAEKQNQMKNPPRRYYSGNVSNPPSTSGIASRARKTILFVMTNGKTQEMPCKVVLTESDFDNWDMILQYIARTLDIPKGIQYLYTVFGDPIENSRDIQNGCIYVAVARDEKFINMNYIQIFQTLLPMREIDLKKEESVYSEPKGINDPPISKEALIEVAKSKSEGVTSIGYRKSNLSKSYSNYRKPSQSVEPTVYSEEKSISPSIQPPEERRRVSKQPCGVKKKFCISGKGQVRNVPPYGTQDKSCAVGKLKGVKSTETDYSQLKEIANQKDIKYLDEASVYIPPTMAKVQSLGDKKGYRVKLADRHEEIEETSSIDTGVCDLEVDPNARNDTGSVASVENIRSISDTSLSNEQEKKKPISDNKKKGSPETVKTKEVPKDKLKIQLSAEAKKNEPIKLTQPVGKQETEVNKSGSSLRSLETMESVGDEYESSVQSFEMNKQESQQSGQFLERDDKYCYPSTCGFRRDSRRRSRPIVLENLRGLVDNIIESSVLVIENADLTPKEFRYLPKTEDRKINKKSDTLNVSKSDFGSALPYDCCKTKLEPVKEDEEYVGEDKTINTSSDTDSIRSPLPDCCKNVLERKPSIQKKYSSKLLDKPCVPKPLESDSKLRRSQIYNGVQDKAAADTLTSKVVAASKTSASNVSNQPCVPRPLTSTDIDVKTQQINDNSAKTKNSMAKLSADPGAKIPVTSNGVLDGQTSKLIYLANTQGPSHQSEIVSFSSADIPTRPQPTAKELNEIADTRQSKIQSIGSKPILLHTDQNDVEEGKGFCRLCCSPLPGPKATKEHLKDRHSRIIDVPEIREFPRDENEEIQNVTDHNFPIHVDPSVVTILRIQEKLNKPGEINGSDIAPSLMVLQSGGKFEENSIKTENTLAACYCQDPSCVCKFNCIMRYKNTGTQVRNSNTGVNKMTETDPTIVVSKTTSQHSSASANELPCNSKNKNGLKNGVSKRGQLSSPSVKTRSTLDGVMVDSNLNENNNSEELLHNTTLKAEKEDG